MSTQRDELAREIHSTEQLGCGCCTDYNYTREQDQHADKLDVNTIAVAIGDTLLAAGWTKPRTITTAEELDDLDADSVLRTKRGTLYTKGRDRDVLLSGVGWFTTSDAIAEEQSFTVLYEPTA